MAKCILLVENNPADQKLVRVILEGAGHGVEVAGDADACFAFLEARVPDLVLMDISLPGKDGLQIVRELRANPATSRLRIVALTAQAMIGDEERAKAAGCDGYITKPMDIRAFRAEVARFLELPR